MHRAKVLLITDDAQVGGIWEYALSQLELEVILLTTPQEALQWRAEHVSDLIVIDENSRTFDGIALIRQWREEIAAPIILLAGGDHWRALEAYRAGVDECIIKPISPALFLAKIKAWMRHTAAIPIALLNNVDGGPFRLYPMTQEVVAYDHRIALTNLEFRLLHLLITHPNQVLSPQTLIDRVWHYSSEVEGTVLKNAIYRLRRKTEPDSSTPQHIVTIPGEGYMFKP
jgi:DNA-binding response OmpR family regulator